MPSPVNSWPWSASWILTSGGIHNRSTSDKRKETCGNQKASQHCQPKQASNEGHLDSKKLWFQKQYQQQRDRRLEACNFCNADHAEGIRQKHLWRSICSILANQTDIREIEGTRFTSRVKKMQTTQNSCWKRTSSDYFLQTNYLIKRNKNWSISTVK